LAKIIGIKPAQTAKHTQQRVTRTTNTTTYSDALKPAGQIISNF